MDIQIVHNGVQMGPFAEETVHAMLKSGSVLVNDLAWRPGLPTWVPLMNVLYPAATTPAPPVAPAQTEAPADEPPEPATARQKAFLSYMHVAFAAEISREDASLLVNDTMENPKEPARLARWNEERLHLHPELFAAEIQTKKEHRPQRFLEICHAEGAPYFEKVTKAHCQVLVSHLDVHSPNWDANDHDATWLHFFPAMVEKFPPLVTPEGIAKFKSAGHPAVLPKQVKSTPVAVRARPRPTSKPSAGRIIYALARGVFLGLIILGLLWIGRGVFAKKPKPVKKAVAMETATLAPADASAAGPVVPATAATEGAPAPTEAPKPISAVADPAPVPTPGSTEPAMVAAGTTTPPASPEPPAKSEMPALFSANEPGATPTPRTSVVLTKAVPITLPFGKISVPAGTAVKIVSQNGAALTVQYLEHVVVIPASSTDLAAAPAGALPPSQ